MSSAVDNEKRTFRIDSLRQSADGFFEPLIESVFLIIAISFFSSGDFWKGLIAASKFLGYLLSAPLTGLLNRSGIPRARILSLLTVLSAVFLFLGMTATGGIWFAVAVTCSSAAFNLRQPFFTDLYGEMYPSDRRARRISLGLRLLLVVSIGMGLCYGRLLDMNLSFWRWIFAAVALVMLAMAVLLLRLPGDRSVIRTENWLQALAIPFRNGRFLYVQASWMLIGFGNLWTLPLRAVYLAEADRGLGLSPATVTFILVVIPAAAKLLFNPLWARLYHQLSFPALRMAINMFFLTSIPLFFLTDRLWVIVSSSVLFGMGTSGSPFIWQLWVTRIAQPSETRIFQSAHAFLAGIRGVVAPFVGLAVLQGLSFRTMGFISCGLSVAATAMMLPLMHHHRKF